MVNAGFTRVFHALMTDPLVIDDVEIRLACAYVPMPIRSAVACLWAIDTTLGGILRGGREPIIAQMRLTWWHEALCRLDDAPPPAQPLLIETAARLLPMGVSGAALAAMIDGWEELVDPDPLGSDALGRYAEGRGQRLFTMLAEVLGSEHDPVAQAGQGWALVDLAWNSSEPQLRADAIALAKPLLRSALAPRWSRAGRPIGMLAWLAMADITPIERGTPRRQGAPGRMFRMAQHALTGR